MGRFKKGGTCKKQDLWHSAGGKEVLVKAFLKHNFSDKVTSDQWVQLSRHVFKTDKTNYLTWLKVVWTEDRRGLRTEVLQGKREKQNEESPGAVKSSSDEESQGHFDQTGEADDVHDDAYNIDSAEPDTPKSMPPEEDAKDPICSSSTKLDLKDEKSASAVTSNCDEESHGHFDQTEEADASDATSSGSTKLDLKDAYESDTASFVSMLEVGQNDDHCSVDESKEDTKTSSLPSQKTTQQQQQFFTHKLPDQPCFFFLSRTDWSKLRRKQRKNRFKTLQWTNIIAKGIRHIHPYCSFAFKRHRVKIIGSKKKGPVFTCSGYCLFKECPVLTKVRIDSESSLKAMVTFEGSMVQHEGDHLKRRPIRAEERQEMAEKLAAKAPRALHLERLMKLEDDVYDSGCRDELPTPGVLKTISHSERIKKRLHKNEMMSLHLMSEAEEKSEDRIIQKIILKPKGIMLWSRKTIHLFYERAKTDIVYLDATGSVVKKAKGTSSPFYIYEVVVRHPVKGCSPVPVATFVTSEHTTASISYFLGSFITDCMKVHGRNVRKKPVMYICDGSAVLMQSIAQNLCGLSLTELITQYHSIVTGQAKENAIGHPILHRCLSHVMKNAKALCKKHAGKHYLLCMHVFGLMTQTTTLKMLDEVVLSATVVLSSPSSGENVEKHFHNLQTLLTSTVQPVITEVTEEDFWVESCPTPLDQHFKAVIQQAPLDTCGEPNAYHCPKFIEKLQQYFLPQAVLWSGLLLGDLGRHGTGPVYEMLSEKYDRAAQNLTQNYTKNNTTQGIMEKSQWDLKKIRFQNKRLTRLDDFVHTYKEMHEALLREYSDSLKIKSKSHRVDVEKWKQRKQRRRGVYVTPMTKPFDFKKATKSKALKKKKTLSMKDAEEKDSNPDNVRPQVDSTEESTLLFKSKDDQQPLNVNRRKKFDSETTNVTDIGTLDEDAQTPTLLCQGKMLSVKSPEATDKKPKYEEELNVLWKRKNTEVVVSVIPSANHRGSSFLIHHSELCSLRPHQWLTGEVMEVLLHLYASQLNLGKTIFILNHYTAGVILFGEGDRVRQHSLRRTDFNNYEAILSFVNIGGVHWNLLYVCPALSAVFLLDPMANKLEKAGSTNAAKRIGSYLRMRNIVHGKNDWSRVKWRGLVMDHPVQQDQSSCGVIVTMMAKALMETYPSLPHMSFGTSKNDMALERRNFALALLSASVFDLDNKCAMCSDTKPPGKGPPTTCWIQCGTCERWYHEQCLTLTEDQVKKARAAKWDCDLCK